MINKKAFFSKKFLGFGLDIDFCPPISINEIHFTSQLTLFYFRAWIVFYKKRK